MGEDMKRYRVAQWGTGHSGLESLRSIINHPQMELTGVKVYNPGKVGVDAGELCGLPATGIRATQSRDEIIAARPDCVMYFPAINMTDPEDMIAILEAGINIVSLIAEFYHVPSLDPEVRSRVEAACEKGNSSFFATGPNPGFASVTLPLGAISFQRRLDSVTLYEYADMSSRTADMNKGLWGWVPEKGHVDDMAAFMTAYYGEALKQTADAIGMPIEEFTAERTAALAKKDTEIVAMTVREGTVAGYLFDLKGWHKGKVLMRFVSVWWVSRDLDRNWELRDVDGWRLVVEGDTPLDISVRFAEAYGETGNSSGYNSHICVNSVPNCVEARPGILTHADMPMVVAKFA